MSTFAEQVEGIIEGGLRQSFGEKVMGLDNIVSSFKYKTPSEAASAFRNSQFYGGNNEIDEIITVTRDNLRIAISDLGKIDLWIALNVPKVEDGGNFGVAVQSEVKKWIKEQRTELKKLSDGLPDYYKDRQGQSDKVAGTVSKVTKTGTSASKSTGKDGDENKTSESNSTDVTNTDGVSSHDAIEYLVALDVKWYFNLYDTMEYLRDTIAIVNDVLEKNHDKVSRPKGERGGKGHFDMF